MQKYCKHSLRLISLAYTVNLSLFTTFHEFNIIVCICRNMIHWPTEGECTKYIQTGDFSAFHLSIKLTLVCVNSLDKLNIYNHSWLNHVPFYCTIYNRPRMLEAFRNILADSSNSDVYRSMVIRFAEALKYEECTRNSTRCT